MKILWKDVADLAETSKSGHITVEHILVPTSVYNEIVDALRDSAQLLPATIRSFQDWQVGLLQRFRAGDFTIHQPEHSVSLSSRFK